MQNTFMELYRSGKIPFLVLAGCIAFSVLFAGILITAEHDHDCTGEDCPVCLQIEAAGYFIKTLKLAVIGLFFVMCSVFSRQITIHYIGFVPLNFSLVKCKARFNS